MAPVARTRSKKKNYIDPIAIDPIAAELQPKLEKVTAEVPKKPTTPSGIRG